MTEPSLYLLNGADRARRKAAEQWLLRAAKDPQDALNEWNRGTAVLVAGRNWDAVRVPYTLLDPAFTYETEPDTLRTLITRLRLVGPSFADPYGSHTYFLVPPRTDKTWPHAELTAIKVECLGATKSYMHHVGVPSLGRTERPGMFWLMPPDSAPFRHVDATHLLAVLRERRLPAPYGACSRLPDEPAGSASGQPHGAWAGTSLR
jgi:hypothetical protein